MESELKAKTARGLMWGGISNAAQQLLNLVFGIILARILSPSDYGMVGMLSVFSVVAGALQEAGFTNALINRKEDRKEDYDSVFWCSITVSFGLYILLFFLAPLIARFFRSPELVGLSRLVFLGFFISSFGVAQNAWLSKHLMVKQKAIAAISALTVSGTVGTIMALKGFSYWGLATQSLTYIFVNTSLWWVLSPWRPSWNFSLQPVREMFPFSVKILITNIFIHLNNNVFSIILGRFYTKKDVGNYSQANKWNNMGWSLVNGMLSGVSQPVLAEVSEERERQLRVFRKMVRFTAFVSFPALFGLSLIAPDFISLAITDKWAESAGIMRILCIGGAFLPLSGLFSSLLISKGRSEIHMWSNVVLGLLQISLLVVLRNMSIITMVSVYSSVNVLWLMVWYFFVRMETGYRLRHFAADILPYLAATVAVMAATRFATLFICGTALRLAAETGIAVILYLSVMLLADAEMLRETIYSLPIPSSSFRDRNRSKA